MKEVTKEKFENYLKKWPNLERNLVLSMARTEYYSNNNLIAVCAFDEHGNTFEPHASSFYILRGEGK